MLSATNILSVAIMGLALFVLIMITLSMQKEERARKQGEREANEFDYDARDLLHVPPDTYDQAKAQREAMKALNAKDMKELFCDDDNEDVNKGGIRYPQTKGNE